MGQKTNTYLLIIILSILIIVIIVFQLFYSSRKQLGPSPTPIPTSANNSNTFPNITTSQQDSVYSFDNLAKDYNRIINKKELSESDRSIKNSLVGQALDKSIIVTDQENFKVKYLPTPQYFMVEINSGDADETKQSALDWFKSQGFSQEGICNLPVIFYLSTEKAEQYRENQVQFDPTIEGCN